MWSSLAGNATAVGWTDRLCWLDDPARRALTGGLGLPVVNAWSLLAGPILLLVADTVGRVITPPSEIQVGGHVRNDRGPSLS